ncbi:MAG: hypothetical protein J6B11_07330, partial [Spirochaetales bacterium]|nr:hypothetical protein [Spirochaetales bacterium]
RIYFREVISSYNNENFRSAIVMLYSTVISDLIIKLQDLRDADGDEKATKILSEIEEKRNSKSQNGTQYDSSWERDIVTKIAKDTELIESHVKIKIDHLHEIRNLCSHPALTSEFELYQPTKEETIAFIKELYQEILVKPPFYIGNVLNKLTDDLVIQKENFRDDYDTLKFYLEKRYFNRMSDKMFLNVFKTLWKFIFKRDENQQCIENRDINLKCIKVMLSLRKDLLFKEIKGDESYNDFSPNPEKCELLIDLFISIPNLYENLSPLLKEPFGKILSKLPSRKGVLRWYMFNNFQEYYEWLENDDKINWETSYSRSTVKTLQKYFLDNGLENEWVDYAISYFSKSETFDSADSRFNLIVRPLLDKINKFQLDDLLNAINDNNQIYLRRRSLYDNSQIVTAVSQRLNLDETYFSKYKNFRYDNFF